jgi:hypothetical protein
MPVELKHHLLYKHCGSSFRNGIVLNLFLALSRHFRLTPLSTEYRLQSMCVSIVYEGDIQSKYTCYISNAVKSESSSENKRDHTRFCVKVLVTIDPARLSF